MSAITEPRNRKPNRGELWFTRPDDADPGAHIPWFGYKVQHAMIASDHAIYQGMRSLAYTELPNRKGRLIRGASITSITAATAKFTHDRQPMPRRTVAHRLASMARKGIISRWDASAATTSPIGTHWRVPEFTEVLENWSQDPHVFTPKNRQFFYRGKGRELVTPAFAIAWKINGAIAEANPAAHAREIPLEQANAAAQEPELQTPAEIDLGPLMNALIDVCGAAAIDDAQFVWKTIVKVCGNRPVPTVDEACAMVREIGRSHRAVAGGRAPITPGFIGDPQKGKISGRVESWQRHRSHDAAERARAAGKARDMRINGIARWLQELQRDDLPPDERTFYAEQLGEADPAEVEEAYRTVEQTRSRTA